MVLHRHQELGSEDRQSPDQGELKVWYDMGICTGKDLSYQVGMSHKTSKLRMDPLKEDQKDLEESVTPGMPHRLKKDYEPLTNLEEVRDACP